jgi:hypothetical protein
MFGVASFSFIDQTLATEIIQFDLLRHASGVSCTGTNLLRSFDAGHSSADFGDVVCLCCSDSSKGSRGEAPLLGADSVAGG